MESEEKEEMQTQSIYVISPFFFKSNVYSYPVPSLSDEFLAGTRTEERKTFINVLRCFTDGFSREDRAFLLVSSDLFGATY